jgi:CDP-diacylglycerol--glycerol-3-phosphate 3-phosphatidyltransferase
LWYLLFWYHLCCTIAYGIACFWLEGSNAAMIQALFFVLLGLTDFADGWLARYLQQESHFGAVMDPIADKLLVIITLIMLLSNDTISGIHTLAVILIISREIIISGLREALVQVNSNKLAVPLSIENTSALVQKCFLQDRWETEKIAKAPM